MESLREKRKKLGLTQAQMAKLCGVSRRTYQSYEETDKINSTAEELHRILDDMGILDGRNCVLGVRLIKQKCTEVFRKYPEVKCAYLYGSYARGEATGKSDVDILVVCKPMGLRFYGLASDLEETLSKKVDLQTHRQIVDSEDMIENLLTEGIKIYEKLKIPNKFSY